MIKYIKNTTANDIFIVDVGQVFPASSESLLNPTQYPYFESSLDIIPYVIDGSFIVNDGDYDLSPRVGLGLLQNNSVVLTEYYTLTDDGEILVGDGEILQLHDELWELSDDGEVDDDPTWR